MITNGLVLYAPMFSIDLQGSPFVSKDDYGHVCTVEGALWIPQGRTFDGIDDVVRAPNNAAYSFTKASSFTLAAWIKMSAAPAALYGLISKWDEVATIGYFLGIYNPGAGASRLILQQSSTGYKYAHGGTDLADNLFHFVVSTYDGSDTLAGYKLYIDSIEETYTSGSNGIIGDLTTTEVLRIGKRGATASPLAGTIGEAIIYNRALTPAEIAYIHTQSQRTYRACWGFFTWA